MLTVDGSQVLPETRLQLTLDYQAEKSQLKFSYTAAEQVFSSGVLAFRSGEAQ